jgi:hypothetical protein
MLLKIHDGKTLWTPESALGGGGYGGKRTGHTSTEFRAIDLRHDRSQ